VNTKPNDPVPPTPDDYTVPEPDYPTFAPGTRVRDVYGNMHVVAEQVGCAVYARGSNAWFHPAKVFVVAD
jgi:hypothetical protein